MQNSTIVFLEALPQFFADGAIEQQFPKLIRDGLIELHPSCDGMTVACATNEAKKLIRARK